MLDSIYNGYPIGSILLWYTQERLASERSIGELQIDDRYEEYPINYLLDGQQRLTTLCGALYWNGINNSSIWNVVFDLDKEEFIHPDGKDKPEYFPLNKLINTADFIKECKKLSTLNKADDYMKNAEKLLSAVKDYKLAAVTIGDMKVDEVAPIFERINSTGRRLTMVDLMRAATWSGSFDLSDAIKSVRETLEPKQFDDVTEIEILRNISTCLGLGLNKEDINKLRDYTSDELKKATNKCIHAYERAVDFLTTELPLPSTAFLPYALQLTLLVEFFDKRPNPNLFQRESLKKWFWQTSFSRYFASFNTPQLNKDISDIRKFASDEIGEIPISKPIDFSEIFESDFRLNKAVSKTYALLLASKGPKSLLDGSTLNIKNTLSIINKNEFHHIFPKNYLLSLGVSNLELNIHPNICILSMINNRTISNSPPGEYFLKIKESLGEKILPVLESNLITNEMYGYLIQMTIQLLLNQGLI